MRVLLVAAAMLAGTSVVAQQPMTYPVAIPDECAALAKREGVPRVLKNEGEAKDAQAKLASLSDSDPLVRDCRQAVRRATARYMR